MPVFPRTRRGGAAAGYVIENAVRFNDDDSAYLNRTWSTGDSTTKFGFSWWVKLGALGTIRHLFCGAGSQELIRINADGSLEIMTHGQTKVSKTTQLFRDPTAWMSIIVSLDTTQGTDTDRVKVWTNGNLIAEADYTTRTLPTASQAFSELNTAAAHYLGRKHTAANYMDGYFAEVIGVDGTIAETDVGEFDSNGNWVPKEITIATDTGDVLIGGGEGTIIDNPNTSWNSGPATRPAGAFDGTYTGGYAASGVNGAAPCSGSFVGKDWGVGVSRTLTNCKVYPTTGGHFSNTGTGTFKLYGSDSDPGTDGTDGTELATWSTSTYPDTTPAELTPVSTTAYRYHWVTATHTASVDWALMEIEFIEDGIPGFGTNGFYLDFSVAPGTGYGAGTDVSKGGSFVNKSDGTNIGDLTLHGGLAGGNNDTYNETTAGAAKASGTGYIGKTWAAAKTITGFYIESYSNKGFVESATPTVTCTVYGKDGAAPSSSTDGTSLYTDSQTDGNNVLTTFESDAITATEYDHIWVEISSAGANVHVGEVEWYENGVAIGRRNHFTESGLAANDQVTDTPTDSADDGIGNACVWNPIFEGGTWVPNGTLANGNLEVSGTAGGSVGTIAASSGKYYFELDVNDSWGGATVAGIVALEDAVFDAGTPTNTRGEVSYKVNGTKTIDGVNSAYGNASSVVSGDYIGVALDLDNGAVWFCDNGTWVDGDGTDSSATVLAEIEAGTTTSAANATLTSGQNYTAFFGSFSNGDACGLVTGLGKALSGAAPTSFKALSTANLPAPAIVDPSAHFQVHGYTGTGAAHDETFGNNTSMDPNLIILKNRDTTDEWKVVDTDRGATKELNPDSTAAESTDANGIDDLGVTDGFGLGTGANGYNDSGEDFISYNFKEGTVVGINSSVSHTAATPTNIAHGLGVTPRAVIAKQTGGTGSWFYYHAEQTSLTNSYWNLDVDAQGIQTLTDAWGAHTSTNTIIDAFATGTYVVYSFAEIAGMSKIGSYIGNGSTDGTFVYTGFRPAMVFHLNLTSADEKILTDATRSTYNPTKHYSDWAANSAERTTGTQVEFDYLSNGFKPRVTHARCNASGSKYLFMAFAEHPFGGSGVSQARAR